MKDSEFYRLGEITDEELFNQLYRLAQQNFPNETAKAESWLREQALRYGIIKAQDAATMVMQSPLTWLAGGLLLGWIVKR